MTIPEFVAARGIKHLFHFTRLGNLDSILANGLLPRNVLRDNGTMVEVNDVLRLDNTDGVCLSIGFPNYKMFYRLRSENPGVEWGVIAVSASILWQNDCAFCRSNAASTGVTNIPLALRRGEGALQEMFTDYNGIARDLLNIPPHFTTNPQAEVLVFDRIAPQNFAGIVFNNPALTRRYTAMNLPFKFHTYSSYFSARQDFEHWRAHG